MKKYKLFYVNRWGRDKKEKLLSRVGADCDRAVPTRFFSMAEENSITEITEVTRSMAGILSFFSAVH